MGKKATRIAELEDTVGKLARRLGDLTTENDRLREQIKSMGALRKPSLKDAARHEWQQFTDRILEGLGL